MHLLQQAVMHQCLHLPAKYLFSAFHIILLALIQVLISYSLKHLPRIQLEIFSQEVCFSSKEFYWMK